VHDVDVVGRAQTHVLRRAGVVDHDVPLDAIASLDLDTILLEQSANGGVFLKIGGDLRELGFAEFAQGGCDEVAELRGKQSHRSVLATLSQVTDQAGKSSSAVGGVC